MAGAYLSIIPIEVTLKSIPVTSLCPAVTSMTVAGSSPMRTVVAPQLTDVYPKFAAEVFGVKESA